ncbi:hypothetical protein AVE30378_02515 [Achromobacter veterisilvae]|uniref:Uncharacterized protein n=1 Tax=Achromobacter veterisilvae TaxID=2069367 RepID=A0A446CH85_9BURK|nr:hypothetical protein [Achromobacter veterisilvae]SSW67229.1 hypothetical protein AVE30378_02515 [Achromobacter veterisilvae]
MSFHTTIARLREASFAAPAAGDNPNICQVRREDLRSALHLIDRLDADVRQAGVITQCESAGLPTFDAWYAAHHNDSTFEHDRQQRAGDGMAHIRLLTTDHSSTRVDYTGLLGQSIGTLKRGGTRPDLAEMLRQLTGHLKELGQRWYAGDTAVVDEILQLYCIESEARAALVVQPGAQKQEPLPTESMVVAGFEAVSCFQDTETYKALSGCRQSAESARVCWAAMVQAMPEGSQPRQDRPPTDEALLGLWAEAFWPSGDICESKETVMRFARQTLARFGAAQKQGGIDAN